MANRATLKTYFETGDVPTEAQFAQWLDECWLKSDEYWLQQKGTAKGALLVSTAPPFGSWTHDTLLRYRGDAPGFPDEALTITFAGLAITGTSGSPIAGSNPLAGAGTRFMWIPAKGAFVAGVTAGTDFDNANVGANAFVFATGAGTRATSTRGIAMGNANTATGGQDNAAVGGFNNDVSGVYAGLFCGANNIASAQSAGIVGGEGSTIASAFGFGGGGVGNLIYTGLYSAYVGGLGNIIVGASAVQVGGNNVTINGARSVGLGGSIRAVDDADTADAINLYARNAITQRITATQRVREETGQCVTAGVAFVTAHTFSMPAMGAGITANWSGFIEYTAYDAVAGTSRANRIRFTMRRVGAAAPVLDGQAADVAVGTLNVLAIHQLVVVGNDLLLQFTSGVVATNIVWAHHVKIIKSE